jgi:hypothetical protein
MPVRRSAAASSTLNADRFVPQVVELSFRLRSYGFLLDTAPASHPLFRREHQSCQSSIGYRGRFERSSSHSSTTNSS